MKGSLGKMPLWVLAAAAVMLMALMLGQSANSGSASGQEKRIAEVLQTIQGAGRVEVALFFADTDAFSQKDATRPTGAVVVAEGAGDMGVRLSLIRAMRTLLGLSEKAVDVFVMEGKQ